MANQAVRRYRVVSTNPATSNHAVTEVALYAADGTQLICVKKQPAQVDSVAADLTAMKVDFNALLLKLRNAGILTP